jgi:hypothetical protein
VEGEREDIPIPAGEADIDEVHYDVVRRRGLSTSLELSLVLENGTAVSVRRWCDRSKAFSLTERVVLIPTGQKNLLTFPGKPNSHCNGPIRLSHGEKGGSTVKMVA